MIDLIQRARELAAEHIQADHFQSEFQDPENTRALIQFYRDGAYDDDAIVQASMAALREGMDLALAKGGRS